MHTSMKLKTEKKETMFELEKRISKSFNEPANQLLSIWPKMLTIPNSYINSIEVDGCVEVGDHFEFIFKIHGRTRFLHGLSLKAGNMIFQQNARYSDLTLLHNGIKQELEPYLTAQQLRMPAFPKKTWFSSGLKVAKQRVVQLNIYFGELFDNYMSLLSQSPSLFDFFAPKNVDLQIFGLGKSERKEFLQGLTYLVAHQYNETTGSFLKTSEQLADSRLQEELVGLWKKTKMPKPRDKEFSWKNYVPFDYLCGKELFRVDVQNNYLPIQSFDPFNLYQSKDTVLVFLFNKTDKKTFYAIKKYLEVIRLCLLDATMSLPPFVIIGLGEEQTKHEITSSEVSKELKDLFEGVREYKYIDASYVTGLNMVEALAIMLGERKKKRGEQETKSRI
eukprot:TRINITY_DN795_c0_g1_i1.p1 TRINITY_DN795_c0_g1~~TRINITY_DN795_c0_g1_i1.p1  ORF type:complete len:390 (+),score=76.17 TRINITY_DN795_c0_g1_i1:57-1226(+)